MCVAYFAWLHPHLPDILLLVAFNRDEVLERPTAESHFWQDDPTVLGGRDLVAGGTWLCISTNGRAAFLTNFRELRDNKHLSAPSRGALPVDFVRSQDEPGQFLAGVDAKAYPGFNLLAADLARSRMAYLCSKDGQLLEVQPGLHGITNGHMDSPHWPKVDEGRRRLQELIDRGAFANAGTRSSREDGSRGGDGGGLRSSASSGDAGGGGPAGGESSQDGAARDGGASTTDGTAVPWEDLFCLLSDDTLLERDPDQLPPTGFGHTFEANASSIFVRPIDTQWGAFGTRCQTLLAVWRDGRGELQERHMGKDGSWQGVQYSFRVCLAVDGEAGRSQQQARREAAAVAAPQQQQEQQPGQRQQQCCLGAAEGCGS